MVLFVTGLMLQEVRPNKTIVHHHRSVVLDRNHAVNEEDALQQQNTIRIKNLCTATNGTLKTHLQQPVQRNERRQEIGEELKQREGGVHYPVRQPFGVVALRGRFNSFDRNVRRVRHTDQVAQQLGTATEHQV